MHTRVRARRVCVYAHRRVIVRRADAERKINIEFTSRLRIHVGREAATS